MEGGWRETAVERIEDGERMDGGWIEGRMTG